MWTCFALTACSDTRDLDTSDLPQKSLFCTHAVLPIFVKILTKYYHEACLIFKITNLDITFTMTNLSVQGLSPSYRTEARLVHTYWKIFHDFSYTKVRTMPRFASFLLLCVVTAVYADTLTESAQNTCPVVTCSSQGLNGFPGKDGRDGAKGEKGEPGMH